VLNRPGDGWKRADGFETHQLKRAGSFALNRLAVVQDKQEAKMLRYAFTIFTSAFLLFQVQPLIGRFVLPWFGGGPSIWTTCMLFFQLVLLAGYLYSHLLSTRVGVRSQVVIHISILALSLLFLPIIPSEAWKPTSEQAPSWQILWLLLATVGGPYFMLSTTGPLLQRWFSRTSPGESPYRLYALSNVGSLLALLSYPFVFEPWMRLRQQAMNWTIAYLVFAGLVAWCATRLWQQLGDQTEESMRAIETMDAQTEGSEGRSPRWWQMSLWLGLSACGSVMLLATTNQLCIDVATVPFLWVLPLSIYLLTFILCFDSPRWYDRRVFGLMLLITAPAACWVLRQAADAAMLEQIAIYSATLFACCMTCHGELVRSKPHPRYLTHFFLLVSAGGALGGLFVAIIATQLFLGYWEYHIGLAASVLLTLLAWCSQRVWLDKITPIFGVWVIASGAQIAAIIFFLHEPLTKGLESSELSFVYGIYSLSLLVGLVLTVALEKKRWPLNWVWSVFSLLQMAWLGIYMQWHIPELLTTRAHVQIALGITVPTLFSLLALWIITSRSERGQQTSIRVFLAVSVSLYLGAFWYLKWFEPWQIQVVAGAFVVALVTEGVMQRLRSAAAQSWGFWLWMPIASLLGLLSFELIDVIKDDDYDIAHVSRNFYGILKVRYNEAFDDDNDEFGSRYSLAHGQIMHGFQYTDDYWKLQPTTYYGHDSGIGLAIRLSTSLAESTDQHPMRMGIVGLGTGSLAAYGRSGDHFRFYEINPDVLALSGKYFTYLSDSAADTQVVLGDARIAMERELAAGQSQQFDVLAIDAFSSDAIPVHLLTTECAQIYRQHLRPGGILALHVSNRFLDLGPVARGLADSLQWEAFQIENEDDDSIGVYGSTWILITDNKDITTNKEIKRAHVPWEESEKKISWTDDYSGLWRVLSF